MIGTCLFCGKTFEKTSPTSFCSRSCANTYRAQHRKPSRKIPRYGYCPVCGKKFSQPFKGIRIYCSPECRIKSYAKKKRSVLMIKNCLFCGKEFEAKKRTQKLCSSSCVGLYNWQNMSPVIKTCLSCGKEFETKNPQKKYCSPECRTKAQGYYKICPVCGKQFKTNSKNRIFCSTVCRDAKPETRCTKREPSPFDIRIKEADACGLSYGYYSAQLRLGKTFEELKAAYELKQNCQW